MTLRAIRSWVLRGLGGRDRVLSHYRTVWIDVGAHLGEYTYPAAEANDSLIVYAFEPNLKIAAERIGRLANFVVLPLAVSDVDGVAKFHINAEDQASSLLPMDPEGKANWKGGATLRVEREIAVQTIRLDTFMDALGIRAVDYLKIDAQGADLAVVRSAGARLADVRKIMIEVDVSPFPLYQGSGRRDEVASYLAERGFALADTASQTFGQEENLTFVRS